MWMRCYKWIQVPPDILMCLGFFLMNNNANSMKHTLYFETLQTEKVVISNNPSHFKTLNQLIFPKTNYVKDVIVYLMNV